jgi:uncharacterized membrane protein
MIAAAFFALGGVVASGIAWRTHWEVRSRPPSAAATCTLFASMDCAKAARSDYAVFLRVPLALWGALGFSLLLVLALLAAARRPETTFPAGLHFVVSAVAFLVSAALALVSRIALGMLCPECTLIQVLGAAVFACSALHLRSVRLGPLRAGVADLGWIAARGRVAAALATLAAAGVGLLVAFYPEHRPSAPRVRLPGIPNGVRAALEGPGDVPTGTTADGHPYIGAARPRATIVEYSDYQCPFCREAHAALRDFVRRHPDRLRLVHVHFPLDPACNPAVPRPFHRRACRLAAAACCAGMQGRFWEMSDALFVAQAEGRNPDLEALAEQSGIDPGGFVDCLAGGAGLARLRRDVDEGSAVMRAARFEPGTPIFELREASGGVLGRYMGFGGDEGIPQEMLRRLDAGWPEEPEGAAPATRR